MRAFSIREVSNGCTLIINGGIDPLDPMSSSYEEFVFPTLEEALEKIKEYA